MAKRVALNFYYDWLEPFEMLTDNEFRILVEAMVRYAIEGKEPPEFRGYAKMAACFVFPQINRAIVNAQNGEKGGYAKAAKGEETPAEPEDEREENKEKGEAEELFETFWEAYPKKTGKSSAREAFLRLGISRDRLTELLSAVERQKGWESWRREGGRYIPSPAAWLSRGQWEDEEPETPKSEPAKHGEKKSRSFDTDDFFSAAIARSYGDMAGLVLGDDCGPKDSI